MTAESCPGDMSQLWAGCWNPHDAQSFLTTGASNVQVCCPFSLSDLSSCFTGEALLSPRPFNWNMGINSL